MLWSDRGGNINFDYETTWHVLVFVEESFKSVVELVVGVPVASYSTHVTWRWLVGLCLIGFWTDEVLSAVVSPPTIIFHFWLFLEPVSDVKIAPFPFTR